MYQAAETKEKVDTLKTDNKRLEDKIEVLGQEMKFLKDIFIAHASGSAPSPAAGAASGRGGSFLSCSLTPASPHPIPFPILQVLMAALLLPKWPRVNLQ